MGLLNAKLKGKFVREKTGQQKELCVSVMAELQNPTEGKPGKRERERRGWQEKERQGSRVRESHIIFFIMLSICLHFPDVLSISC